MRRLLLLCGIFLSAGRELTLVIWDLVHGRSFDDFVYVNQDGTARELSSDERDYLETEFPPGDGGRPYIKGTYNDRDGWGSISGFLLRRRLPSSITVKPINPNFKMSIYESEDDLPDADYETARCRHLELQRAYEEAATAKKLA
jgi:hypothetical protein